MTKIYHTVYENTKRKIKSLAYFNKTYNNSRPLDIGIFVLKRNFFNVHFSDKLKPLRIWPFEITIWIKFLILHMKLLIKVITLLIHRNHLAPYYRKEPIIFPFRKQYNPHSNNDDIDINDSNIHDPIKPFFLFPMKNKKLKTKTTHSQIPIKKRIYHPQLTSKQNYLTNSLHFRTNKINKKTNITNSENQFDFLDYDNYINPRRHTYDRYNFRPQPRKDYQLFLGEKDLISFFKKNLRNDSSSSLTHSFQSLPEYTAYLNSDTDILDSSSSNHSPSAP